MLYPPWCDRQITEIDGENKKLWRLSERAEGRENVGATLTTCIRAHYDHLERIAEDVQTMGFPHAASILAERMPRSSRARSGELGEILATEFVEDHTGFEVPVRRLHYKDGREMALRGDDFIGIRIDEEGNLHFLKGESKSRSNLAAVTIREARAALTRDDGRPTASSLLFVSDRLMEGDEERLNIGRKIRNEVASRATSAANITHALFTMSGNPTTQAQRDDLASASVNHPHLSVHLHIEDHQEFIRVSYERALELGDD